MYLYIQRSIQINLYLMVQQSAGVVGRSCYVHRFFHVFISESIRRQGSNFIYKFIRYLDAMIYGEIRESQPKRGKNGSSDPIELYKGYYKRNNGISVTHTYKLIRYNATASILEEKHLPIFQSDARLSAEDPVATRSTY